MTEPITIRPVTREDWEGIVSVENARYGDAGYDRYFVRMIPHVFSRTCWVAQGSGEIEGYALGAREDGHPDVGWLLSVVVRNDGRGLGARLSRQCVESLEHAGVARTFLTVAPDNVAAIRIYERLGFTRVRFEANYYGPGMDRLLMERLRP